MRVVGVAGKKRGGRGPVGARLLPAQSRRCRANRISLRKAVIARQFFTFHQHVCISMEAEKRMLSVTRMAHNAAAQGLAALLKLGLVIAAIGYVDKFISSRSARQEFFGFWRWAIRDRGFLVCIVMGIGFWVWFVWMMVEARSRMP